MSLLAWVTVLAAVPGFAQCLSPANVCGCNGISRWVVKAEVVDSNRLFVLQAFGNIDAGAPDAGTIISSTSRWLVPGEIVLEDELGVLSLLTSDGGSLPCGNVTVPAEVWIDRRLDGGCEAELESRGINTECRDVVGPFGCSSISGPGLAVLALLGWRLRRGSR